MRLDILSKLGDARPAKSLGVSHAMRINRLARNAIKASIWPTDNVSHALLVALDAAITTLARNVRMDFLEMRMAGALLA